jgi:LPPG:FO 2-phospho-L-lactate transferase
MKAPAQQDPLRPGHYLALCGGVGGAKLAFGLSQLLKERLTVVVNTGDDFKHFGLHISPDIDTVLYTLAGKNNKEQGWGLENESWNFFDAIKELGQESWFQLGDRDLATHITRTQFLESGKTLTQTTHFLSERFSIPSRIIPMSDDPVHTMVGLKNGEFLPFQHYFVREKCQPVVQQFKFSGIESAQTNPELALLFDNPQLKGIIICPSNPFVSIEPILSLPGLREKIKNHPAPTIAVTPIIGGQAVKGPTAKMMQELGVSQSALSIAEIYTDLADGFILDKQDIDLTNAIQQRGLNVQLAQSLMNSQEDKINLARICLDFCLRLSTKNKQQ